MKKLIKRIKEFFTTRTYTYHRKYDYRDSSSLKSFVMGCVNKAPVEIFGEDYYVIVESYADLFDRFVLEYIEVHSIEDLVKREKELIKRYGISKRPTFFDPFPTGKLTLTDKVKERRPR